jgi:hypothetical protein
VVKCDAASLRSCTHSPTSGTTIGLRCTDGLLLAVENVITSKLLVKGSSRRIFPVGDHVGIAVSGASQRIQSEQKVLEDTRWACRTPLTNQLLLDAVVCLLHPRASRGWETSGFEGMGGG